MRGEDDRLVEMVEGVDDPAEPGLYDVRLAVDRSDDVCARLEAEAIEDRRALARDRGQPDRGVGHDVANDLDAALHSFRAKLSRRSFVGAEQESGGAVDLDADVLLGHRPVAAPHPRLDVGERNAGLDRGACAGEGRGGVAVHERPVGPLGRDRVEDPRLHRADHLLVRQPADAEAVGGLRELELFEEDLRQLGVVVLSRAERDLVNSALPEGDRKGR